MTTTVLPRPARPQGWLASLEKLMALLALLNLGLVIFDLSYLRFRDLYFRYLPPLTQHYDWVKGIEPHRDTTQYLTTVDDLTISLTQRGVNSPQTQQLLTELADRSVAMIEEDPFRVANKSGNLEKLKNRMRQRMGNKSAKAAFRSFWSGQHFTDQNWRSELAFFNQDFRPRMAANYFRPIDESGDFVDRFWLLDLGFVGLFTLDLSLRVLWIRRRHRTTWKDALLWRWYDLFLLLPLWRLLRMLPVAVRLHQAGFINLQSIQNQVSHNIAENVAEEVAELVLLQSVGIVQDRLRQGLLREGLKASTILSSSPFVDKNGVDELQVIGQHLGEVVCVVLPKVQPDLEALVRHVLQQAIAQVPLSSVVQRLPGWTALSAEFAHQVAHRSLDLLSNALEQGMADEVTSQLVQQLGQNFLLQVQGELNQGRSLETLETLMVDWLEDLKLTLVQSLQAQDPQQHLRDADALRRQGHSPVEVLPPHPTLGA